MSDDPQLPPTRPFTSIAQAAYRIGVPETWLKKEADEGRVPSLLVGKHRMVNTERVLEALMERATLTPPTITGRHTRTGGTALPPEHYTLG